MTTISLCMIVRDEEAVLARCLDSVKDVVDEMVIVDTGSKDATREIAARYTSRVLDFPWVQDFSAARNASFDAARCQMQLWLDADDVLPPQEAQGLAKLKTTLDPEVDMVTMKYHTAIDDAGRPMMTATRERLIRRGRGLRWQDPVHECIPLQGNILHSNIAVWHMQPPRTTPSTRNLAIYRRLLASGADLSPRQQYYYARELWDHGQLEAAAHWFRLFLQGGRGWVEDNIAACRALAACQEALGQPERARDTLLESLRFDAPRAETCCQLGYHYKAAGRFAQALHWFETAACLPQTDSLGFVQADYQGFVPCLEACVCCCALGDYRRAQDFNERAATFRPEHPAVLHNRAYLASLPGWADGCLPSPNDV